MRIGWGGRVRRDVAYDFGPVPSVNEGNVKVDLAVCSNLREVPRKEMEVDDAGDDAVPVSCTHEFEGE